MSERIEDTLRRVRMQQSQASYRKHGAPSTSINGGTIIDWWCRECGASIERAHTSGCQNDDQLPTKWMHPVDLAAPIDKALLDTGSSGSGSVEGETK
jgi:hypothetical protein